MFLDANSGAVTVTTTNGGISICRSITCTGFTGTLSLVAGSSSLTVGDASGGALTFVAGMTLTITATTSILFIATSDNGGTGWPITTGGKTMPGLTFQGASGKWTLQDACTATGGTGIVTLTNGTLDTNGQTCSWGTFSSSNSNTRTLTMGASAIAITGTSTAWDMTTPTNMTITANTATITCSGAAVIVHTGGLSMNGASLVISGSGAAIMSGSGTTWANITRTGTASQTDSLSLTGNFTATGTFTATGNSVINRILIQSGTVGTARTITAAAVSLTNADFMDTIGAGAASWTGTSLGDCQGNSGITFDSPTTQTNTGATGNWSDVTKWTSRIPLPQDSVVINTGSGTITADMSRLGADINFTGFTGTFTSSIAYRIFGSLTFASGMTVTAPNSLTFSGRGTQTITSAGKTIPNSGGVVNFICPGGTYTLQDAFNTQALNITITDGTFTTNNFNVTAGAFVAASGRAITLNLGTSTVTLTSTASGNIFAVNASVTTLNAGTSTIVIANASSNSRTIAGASGKVFYALTYTVANSPGSLSITGANTFTTLNVGSGRILTLPSATINTVTNFNVNGVVNGYQYQPGVASHYISTPDSAALSITGDIDIRVRVALDDWTPSGAQILMAKRLSAGNQRSFYFRVDTAGHLRLALSADGIAETTQNSSTTPVVADGAILWVRATWRASDGRTQYFTASGSLTNPTAGDFTQLGTDVTIAVASIFDSTAALEVGSTDNGTAVSFVPAAGKFYRAQLRNGIDGTVVYDADFTTKIVGRDTMSESSGNTAAFTGGYLNLPGVAGNYASAPDSAALSITGDLDLRGAVALNDWTPATSPTVLSKYTTTGNQRSYALLVTTSGALRLIASANGSSDAVDVTSSVVTSAVDGSLLLVRATLDVDNGAAGRDVKFYTKTSTAATAPADTLSDSGWTQLGTTSTTAGTVSIFDSTALLEVGSVTAGGANLLAGKVYAAVVKSGIDGTTVFNADFTTQPAYGRQFTESSSNAALVSLNGGVTINGTLSQVGDGRVSLVSSTGGSAATLSKASGVVSVNYLSIQDSAATGGAAWYAGANSVDVSGNTGWVFQSGTTTVQGQTMSEVEYSAYAVRTGLSGITLQEQKLRYYNGQLGTNYISVDEAEIAFLKQRTGLWTENSHDQLWRAYMVDIRGMTLKFSLSEMKFAFFASVGLA